MMFSPEGEYPSFNFIEEFKRERKVISQFISNNKVKGKQPDAELMAGALMGMMLMQILEYFFTGKRTLSRRKAERLVDLLIPSSKAANSTKPVGKERSDRS
jgi:hypothetical protein